MRKRLRVWFYYDPPDITCAALSLPKAREFCGVVSCRFPELYPLLWDETNDPGGIHYQNEQAYLAGWVLWPPPSRFQCR